MKKAYFTFGSAHAHPSCVQPIIANDPREHMFKLHGDKWSHEYSPGQWLESCAWAKQRGIPVERELPLVIEGITSDKIEWLQRIGAIDITQMIFMNPVMMWSYDYLVDHTVEELAEAYMKALAQQRGGDLQ